MIAITTSSSTSVKPRLSVRIVQISTCVIIKKLASQLATTTPTFFTVTCASKPDFRHLAIVASGCHCPKRASRTQRGRTYPVRERHWPAHRAPRTRVVAEVRSPNVIVGGIHRAGCGIILQRSAVSPQNVVGHIDDAVAVVVARNAWRGGQIDAHVINGQIHQPGSLVGVNSQVIQIEVRQQSVARVIELVRLR